MNQLFPSDVDAHRAALATERLAHREPDARASGAEAMVAHLEPVIARLKHDRFGASSERSRKRFDQMELQLEALETSLYLGASPALARQTLRHIPLNR